jgi:hypothetical protein
MKKIYNKNAREKQLLEEAYGAIYERRNPDSGTYDAEGESPGPIAELDPDEEEEHGDFGNRNFKYLLKDVFELSSDPGMEDASSDDWRQRLDDIVRDYSSEFGEDAEDNVNWNEKDEVDEVGGGMNSKEFNTINKTTPL